MVDAAEHALTPRRARGAPDPLLARGHTQYPVQPGMMRGATRACMQVAFPMFVWPAP